MANAKEYEVTTKYNTTKTAKTALRNWCGRKRNWQFYFNVNDDTIIELCEYYSTMSGLPNKRLLEGVAAKNKVSRKNRYKIISALSVYVKQEKNNGK